MAAPTPYTGSPTTTYTIDASTPTDINALLSGIKWGDRGIGTQATIYYSYPISNDPSLWDQGTDAYYYGPGYETYSGFRGLDSVQQAAATLAIQSWANVANINLVHVDTETSNAVGDIRIAFTSDGYMSSDTYAYAYYPGASYGGDIWINTNQPVPTGNDYALGGNGYHTIMHELGHALGLAHPFDNTNTFQLSDPSLDTHQYTVMSYSDSTAHNDTGYSSFYPTTPMLIDILAIQHVYGANMSYRTGNDTYIYNESTYYETIWDAGGTDTIQYTGNNAAKINLNAGSFSTLGNPILLSSGLTQNSNVAIAYGVTIENAIGGNGNDVLIGNEVDNNLNGGAGNDTINGGLGNDILDGGAVNSYITGVTNTLNGDAGNDTFLARGFIGANIYDGGADTDTLDFSQSNSETESRRVSDGAGVHVNLETNLASSYYLSTTGFTWQDPNGLTSLTSIENARGTSQGDILNGNANDNVLEGNAGNDIINGGLGSDILSGGIGADIFKWELADKGTFGAPDQDIITDYNIAEGDVLDLKDLLAEQYVTLDNILNYVDVKTSAGNTEIHISTEGSFTNGIYNAVNEDVQITLTGMDLFAATGSSTEMDIILYYS